jgi:hypothetical protein
MQANTPKRSMLDATPSMANPSGARERCDKRRNQSSVGISHLFNPSGQISVVSARFGMARHNATNLLLPERRTSALGQQGLSLTSPYRPMVKSIWLSRYYLTGSRRDRIPRTRGHYSVQVRDQTGPVSVVKGPKHLNMCFLQSSRTSGFYPATCLVRSTAVTCGFNTSLNVKNSGCVGASIRGRNRYGRPLVVRANGARPCPKQGSARQ